MSTDTNATASTPETPVWPRRTRSRPSSAPSAAPKSKTLPNLPARANVGCRHTVRDSCDTCLASHIREQTRKNLPDVLQCVHDGCKAEIDPSVVQMLLTPAEYARFDDLLMKKTLQGMEEFRWCTAIGCGSGQLVEGGTESNSFFSCERAQCREKTCVRHRVAWHAGITCAEYDEYLSTNATTATEQFLQEFTKQCPSCAASIEKNGGCDIMLCRKEAGGCGFTFCWRCLADMEPIREEGNHRHHEGCAWYFPPPE
jgi:IBR domain, a half RING-finger domain/IBR domain